MSLCSRLLLFWHSEFRAGGPPALLTSDKWAATPAGSNPEFRSDPLLSDKRCEFARGRESRITNKWRLEDAFRGAALVEGCCPDRSLKR
jgi:hypothetical protein